VSTILGLHFGHDSGVAILRDGRILAALVRERITRRRHARDLDADLIRRCAETAGIALGEIDVVAVTNTQKFVYVFEQPEFFRFAVGRHPGHPVLGPLFERGQGCDGANLVLQVPREDRAPGAFVAYGIDEFFYTEDWIRGGTLDEIAARDLAPYLQHDHTDHLILPLVCRLEGRELPGYMVQHHYAHAAGAYFVSGWDRAAILSHDGGARSPFGYHGSMVYLGDGNRLLPLMPLHLMGGAIYKGVGTGLGLGRAESPGKLMGLSGYGDPAFYDARFSGNWYDIQRATGFYATEPGHDLSRLWFVLCKTAAERRGFDLSAIGRPERMTEPANTWIAAAAQKLFEETLLRSVAVTAAMLQGSGVATDRMVLTGGTALNVVANQRVANESAFPNVFVPCAPDDSGLAVGAALAIHHGVLGEPRPADWRANMTPYLGPIHDDAAIEAALAAHGDRIAVGRPDDAALAGAADVAAGRIIAWYEGRSELGPRALGHRSILADPRQRGMNDRVNDIKGRERWRPLAPAVLAEAQGALFDRLDLASPYMSFSADVRGDGLPAIRHIDGTARLQTVGPECGGYYRLIRRFAELSGVGVVMNTSFNGPGEPIVESPEDALAFLLRGRLDALYIEGRKVTRR
jgi:carbamoyltransferase